MAAAGWMMDTGGTPAEAGRFTGKVLAVISWRKDGGSGDGR